jgi:hypothetical protein
MRIVHARRRWLWVMAHYIHTEAKTGSLNSNVYVIDNYIISILICSRRGMRT